MISGGAGCSGVLGAISKDSLELNMVIRGVGDVDCDCWGYENSIGGLDEEVLGDGFLGPWCIV